ncbi:MAG: STAS domain-containing protein [Rhodobacteraceae bacterium]|nr:STAS domain-containing protein [Paracoccaceae bacterium]
MDMTGMEITTEDSLSLIRPVGKIDSTNSQVFEQAMTRLIEHNPTDVLVDLGKVTFVASAGLRVMLNIAK